MRLALVLLGGVRNRSRARRVPGLTQHYHERQLTVNDDEEADRDTDKNGVEFGDNCLNMSSCRRNDTCLGLCKLF